MRTIKEKPVTKTQVAKKATSTRRVSGGSRADAMRKQKVKLDSEKSSGLIGYQKADSQMRVRPVPIPTENPLGFEIYQYYLGPEIKGVISPETLGQPCPIAEKITELKQENDPDNDGLLKALRRSKKILMLCITYKDLKGKEVDDSIGDDGVRFIQLSNTQYNDITEMFFDEEKGDPADPINGYDLKLKREGSGKNNTSYSILDARPTKLPSKYNKEHDIDSYIDKVIPSYDEVAEKLNQFLNSFSGYSDDDDAPADESPRRTATKKSVTKKKVIKGRRGSL